MDIGEHPYEGMEEHYREGIGRHYREGIDEHYRESMGQLHGATSKEGAMQAGDPSLRSRMTRGGTLSLSCRTHVRHLPQGYAGRGSFAALKDEEGGKRVQTRTGGKKHLPAFE